MNLTLETGIHIAEKVIAELASKALNLVIEKLKPVKKQKTVEESSSDETFFYSKIATHFNDVYNWSRNIEFIGLGGMPLNTLRNSTHLNFNFSLRRDNNQVLNDSILEDDFMTSTHNIIIEGNPGSGKTTTLKRLLSFYFFNSPMKECVYNYPLLVRFRNIELPSFFLHLCQLLGVSYMAKKKIIIEEYEEQDSKDQRHPIEYLNYPTKYPDNNRPKVIKKKKEVEITEYFVETDDLKNAIKVEQFISELLEENSVLLILDGLDELKPEMREKVHKEIKSLGLHLLKSKIILTTRPNYINTNFENFAYYNVSSLTPIQKESIAELWIEKNTQNFLAELETKSYKELADRPLFLCFLILLFKESKDDVIQKLPKSSKEVYMQLLDLLVMKWDDDRGIPRTSKYAFFDRDKKLEFLSHLSFHLTYIIKSKIFSHDQLVAVFKLIHTRFDLPIDEAKRVVEEIESHTGLIVKSLYNKYEFSHLSLQEYLCANYIVRLPFSNKINEYLKEYPEVLALAIVLSPEPSAWLAELLRKLYRMSESEIEKRRIATILIKRLTLEQPYFDYDKSIGLAILNFYSSKALSEFLGQVFDEFITINLNIERAIKETLEHYFLLSQQLYDSYFRMTCSIENENYPPIIYLPKKSIISDCRQGGKSFLFF
jgi:hypothetical protein